jgi:hypothetical protein
MNKRNKYAKIELLPGASISSSINSNAFIENPGFLNTENEFLCLGDPNLLFHKKRFEALLWGKTRDYDSPALLLAALQYAERRNYRALLLQPDSQKRSLPKEMRKLLSNYAREQLHITKTGEVEIWKFNRGSSITFGIGTKEFAESYCKNHHFHFIGFDGLTNFKEDDYLAFFSCLKEDPTTFISQRIFSTGNAEGKYPDWVRERFIDCPQEELERENRFIINIL